MPLILLASLLLTACAGCTRRPQMIHHDMMYGRADANLGSVDTQKIQREAVCDGTCMRPHFEPAPANLKLSPITFNYVGNELDCSSCPSDPTLLVNCCHPKHGPSVGAIADEDGVRCVDGQGRTWGCGR